MPPLQCFVYIFTFTNELYTYKLSCCYLTCFNSIWRTLMISFIAGQILLAWGRLYCRHMLKDTFSGYIVLSWQLFPFSTINISTYPLLAWKVSVEKTTNTLKMVPFMWWTTFLLLAKFSDYWQFNCNVSRCSYIYVQTISSHVGFLCLDISLPIFEMFSVFIL